MNNIIIIKSLTTLRSCCGDIWEFQIILKKEPLGKWTLKFRVFWKWKWKIFKENPLNNSVNNNNNDDDL